MIHNIEDKTILARSVDTSEQVLKVTRRAVRNLKGKYVCTVNNQSSSAELDVYCKFLFLLSFWTKNLIFKLCLIGTDPRPSVIVNEQTHGNRKYLINKNEKLDLVCSMKGNPLPLLSWEFEGSAFTDQQYGSGKFLDLLINILLLWLKL